MCKMKGEVFRAKLAACEISRDISAHFQTRRLSSYQAHCSIFHSNMDSRPPETPQVAQDSAARLELHHNARAVNIITEYLSENAQEFRTLAALRQKVGHLRPPVTRWNDC